MSLRLQSSSNCPNTLLKWRPDKDKFMFNVKEDPVGASNLLQLGFVFKPCLKDGYVSVTMPALNKMKKDEREEYLRTHPSILNLP